MQLWRADRPAKIEDFVLAFRPHSDLLPKISTVSARPTYSTAGLLDRRVILIKVVSTEYDDDLNDWDMDRMT